MTRTFKLAVALAFAIAGCNQSRAQIAQQALGTPQTGLARVPLTVEKHDKSFPFRVEVAGTRDHQMIGMMFRTSIGADQGMLFPFAEPRTASFWMRNTLIPLDIIFIGTDRRILNTAANAVPRSEDPLPSNGPVSAVLEIKGGRAAELGIAPGDLVRW